MGWPRRGRWRFVAVNGRSSKEKAPDNGAEGRAGHARHETQLKPFHRERDEHCVPYCDQQQTTSTRETAAMKAFAFKTTIDAVVRVQAADEDSARKAVPTVLAAPGIADIRIANENVIAGLGIDAVIDDVNFNSASDLVLLEVNGERVKRRRG